MNLLLSLVLLGAVPLNQVAEAEPVVFVHVPDLGVALPAVERTSAKALVEVWLPKPLRTAFGQSGGELLAAIYKGSEPGSTEVSVWIDGAPAEVVLPVMREFWQRLGFAAAGREGTVEVFRAKKVSIFLGCVERRCAYSQRRAHVDAMAQAAARPLGATAGYAAVGAQQGALAWVRVDVPKVYGLLARSSSGARWAGLVRRLGLDGLLALEGAVRQRGKALGAEMRLRMPPPHRGLVGALSLPPAGRALPAASGSFVWAHLSPVDALVVAEKLANFLAPIEYTLARAQLDVVESQRGKRLDEHALGKPGQFWLLAGGVEPTLLAEVADPELAHVLLVAFLTALPAVMPDLRLKENGTGQAKVTALSLRGHDLAAVGRTARALVLAPSTAGVQAGRKLPTGKKPVTALAGGELALSGGLLGSRPEIATAVKRLSLGFSLTPQPEGFMLEVELRNR